MKLMSLTFIVCLACSQFAHAVPEIEHWTTANGVRVYFVPAPDLPMLDIEVTFAAGSVRDEAASGLAAMTLYLLNEGTQQHDADAIAEQFANLGARFSVNIGREMASVHLRSLTEAPLLSSAVNLFIEVLSQPSFEGSALERLRQQTLAGLNYKLQQPSEIASETFSHLVYADHPYANDPDGSIEAVSALTREQVQAFHQRYYVAPNAQIALVGALNRAQAEALTQQIASHLPAGEVAASVPPVSELSESKRVHINFPSSQTHILLGQTGMTRDDPDYFSLYVGNQVLGGSGFASELMNEVREKRGLAYSAYSYISAQQREGVFGAGAQTRNDQMETALNVMLDVIKQFIATGPSAEKLAAIKRNITGGFPLRVDSNSKIVNYLTVIGFYGMPLDHLQKFNKHVEAVTAEMIQSAFQRRIHPDKLVIVTVGGEVPAKNSAEAVPTTPAN